MCAQTQVHDVNTNQDLNMKLPQSATEAFRYLAKLALCDAKVVKLTPLASLQRHFVQCTRKCVKVGVLGDDHRGITSITELFRPNVDVTGSRRVALGSSSSTDKESFRFDGHAARFLVNKS